jgi:hypothetical protein
MGGLIMVYIPKNITTTVYSSSLLVKQTSGILYSILGYNSGLSDQFIQVHDINYIPNDGAIPSVIFRVPPQSNFSFDLGESGRGFANGIVICNSSTSTTKTLGSADCWFDVRYR